MSKSKKLINTSIIFSQELKEDMQVNGNFNPKVPIVDMASTMTLRVVRFLKMIRKNKQSIDFALNKKFSVRFVVDGITLKPQSLEGVIVNGNQVEIKLSLVNNEKSQARFINIMESIVKDALDICLDDEPKTFEQVRETLCLN
tara:strand:+ start:6106 stop:6534 length:429 start_codon:yes stop_codon:yes gene_type:complete